MKPALIFFFALIIVIPASAQFLNESHNTDELIKANKVKSETIYQSINSIGNRLNSIKNYDSSGILVSTKAFAFNNQVLSNDTFIYNNQYKCTKKIRFDKRGVLLDNYIYTYDEKGNQSLIEIFRNDTLLHSQKKIYNERNQRIIDSSKYGSGNYFESFLIFYDEEGLKTKTILKLNPDSAYITTFTYNKKKLLTEKHFKRIDSETVYTYYYNSHNQCKKEKKVTEKQGKTTETIVEYTYLPNGLLDKQEEYADDKAPKILTYQYSYY